MYGLSFVNEPKTFGCIHTDSSSLTTEPMQYSVDEFFDELSRGNFHAIELLFLPEHKISRGPYAKIYDLLVANRKNLINTRLAISTAASYVVRVAYTFNTKKLPYNHQMPYKSAEQRADDIHRGFCMQELVLAVRTMYSLGHMLDYGAPAVDLAFDSPELFSALNAWQASGYSSNDFRVTIEQLIFDLPAAKHKTLGYKYDPVVVSRLKHEIAEIIATIPNP